MRLKTLAHPCLCAAPRLSNMDAAVVIEALADLDLGYRQVGKAKLEELAYVKDELLKN